MKKLNYFFIILFFLQTSTLTGQSFDTIKEKNNAFKGMILAAAIPFTMSAALVDLSYEKRIKKHNAILLDCSILYLHPPNEDGTSSSLRYNCLLTYRYYSISKKNQYISYWIGLGVKYQKYDKQYVYEKGLSDFYGINFMIGRQLIFTKTKNQLIEFGIGVSYGQRTYSFFQESSMMNGITNTDLPKASFIFLPEFTILYGGIF